MFTTSRYASVETKTLARKLAKENEELFLARGKRTIEQLVDFARKKGEENISIVEEEGGKPAKVCRIKVSETGKWNWSGEEKI
jgi:rRNA maturation protein Rpf1